MTTFVCLQLDETEVLSDAFVTKVLDQENSTNKDVSSVTYLGIRMAVLNERRTVKVATETAHAVKPDKSGLDNSETAIEERTTGGIIGVENVQNNLNTKANVINYVDLVWQRLREELEAAGADSDADNNTVSDIVQMSGRNRGRNCKLKRMNAQGQLRDSTNCDEGVENAIRKLKMSLERNRNCVEPNVESSIRKIRNVKNEEVNLDNMNGQLEFAVDDSFNFENESRSNSNHQQGTQQRTQIDISGECSHTLKNTESHQTDTTCPEPLQNPRSKSKQCMCPTLRSTNESARSSDEASIKESMGNMCEYCLTKEHDTLIRQLTSSSDSLLIDSNRRFNSFLRRSKRSSSSSLKYLHKSSKSSLDSLTVPACSPKKSRSSSMNSVSVEPSLLTVPVCSSKKWSNSSMKSEESSASVLDESSSQPTQCSAEAVLSLMHPMNKIICNRLKQWKKKPKRKFKLSHLLSCARA